METKLFVSILVTIFFASCSTTDPDSSEPKIVGQWQWVKSINGWSNQTVLPDSVGYSQQIRYSADDTFSQYRAGSLVKTGTYTLLKRDGSTYIKYEIANDDSPRGHLIKFKAKNVMQLISTCIGNCICADCGSSTYKRIDD